MTSLKKVGTRRKFWKEPKPYLVAEAWNYFFLPKEVPILENINCHIFSAQRLRHRKISRSWCTDNVARYVPPFHNILFPDLQNCITFPNCFLRVFVSVALFIVVLEWYPKKSKDAGQFASYRRLKFAQLKPEVDVSRWIWVQLFVSCCDFLLVFHVLFDLNAVRCR